MRASLAVLSLLAVTACGGATDAATHQDPVKGTPAASRTFTVTGSLGVDSQFWQDPPAPCYADDGYTDIKPGTEVVVTDDKGRKVGVGELGRGTLSTRRVCSFPFTVAGVPEGSRFYSVEVGRRGDVTYPRARFDKPLTLTLD